MFPRFRRWLRNLTEASRQREINRLIVRAGRRCARDLRHAVDEIQDPEIQKRYRDRVRMWFEVFWDSAEYRDSLHRRIDQLEQETHRLRFELEKLGFPQDIPF